MNKLLVYALKIKENCKITSVIFFTIFVSMTSYFLLSFNNSIYIFICFILNGIIFYLIKILKNKTETLKKVSVTDSLTGLSNLNYVMEAGEKIIKDNLSLTVFVMDIDQFKRFNDTYGYLIGNKVLIEVANLLKNQLEQINGIIGRLGGEEFVILIKNLSYEHSIKLFNLLNNKLNQESFYCDPELDPIKISCSIGMAYAPINSKIELKELLDNADKNMYYIKQKKTNGQIDIDLNNLISEEEKILLSALAEKDMYSYVHTQYVVQYSCSLAKRLNLSQKKIEDICVAAWLHDIGKLVIPNNILRKKAALTDKEYNIIKCHVQYGLNLIRDFQLSDTIINGIKYHQERFDGKGYPYGILGNETPIEARIIQIADTFSAMTVKRVYRKLLSQEEALTEIIKSSESQFDPKLAKVFVELMQGNNLSSK